jgi:hypothetical protein
VTRVYRTDIATLRPVERRADGTIRVDAHLTKTGVFQYMQRDGSVRRELRLPEDVFDTASMSSFEGVPVTNDHPPGMLTAKNARQFQVGSALGTPIRDEDHMRGRLAVTDADTIGAMESGKTQVSCGYTCDCVEKPGVHPLYGVYDAIQKNIRGNHVAIVDRARAGITAAARMDGMMVLDGIPLASAKLLCKTGATMKAPTARVEVVIKTDSQEPGAGVTVDPDDEASKNERGENDAPKAKKRQPGEMADKGGDRATPRDPDADEDDDSDDDEDEDADKADKSSLYDEDGDLTDHAKGKIAAASFAIPGKQKLPIHDPKAVKDSMKRFGSHEFDDADEKHGAFNRISGKAKQFGINTAGFEKAHAGKLDRADGPKKDTMTDTEIKALQEKASKADTRKEKLIKAKARVDQLEQELAERDGTIASLEKDLEAAKAPGHADAEDLSGRIDAKVELLAQASATGAKVDSKMSDRAIKVAVIKHVDKTDVADSKHDAYVEALYEGAIGRAKTEVADKARGDSALAGVRTVIAGGPAAKQDADDTDEDAAKRRLRSNSSTMWQRKETK